MKAGALFLFSALAAGATFAAQDELKTMMAKSTIQMQASANEAHMACGNKNAKEIEAEQIKQKRLLLKDGAITEATYDKLYADSVAEAKANWSRTTPDKKKQLCQTVKP